VVLRITLPPEGLFIRELVLSELLSLEIDLKIEGDVVIIGREERFKDKLDSELKQSKDVLKELRPYKGRNYKKAYEIAKKVFNGGINEFFKDDDEEYFVPLVFPEIMEAEKWFGLWNGKGKGEKRTIGANRQIFILSLLGLYKYQIYEYVVERNGKYVNFAVLALVDNTIVSEMCRPTINKEKIQSLRKDSAKKLSHISRLLIFSTVLSEQGCQNLLLLEKGQYRAEIYEKNPHAYIKPIIHFWTLVNDEIVEDKFIDLANKYPDLFNRVSNYIFEGIKRTLTPAEVVYMIARDTYLREENLKFIRKDMEKIREALEKIWSEEEVYSQT